MNEINENQLSTLNKFWHKIIELSNDDFNTEGLKELKELSYLEIGVISLVYHHPDIILKEICDALKIPKSSLTNIIDRLENKNYVMRVISKRDRRSFGLELTKGGYEIQKQHDEYERLELIRILAPLSDNERNIFVNLLEKINENI